MNTILLLASLIGTGIPASARATDVLVLSNVQEFAIPLRPFIKVYEDRTGQLDFVQLRKLEAEKPGIFQSADIKHRAPHRNSTWWLQATIANKTDVAHRLILTAGPPNLESIDFYVQQAGGILHTRAGTQVGILEQQGLSRFPTLGLELSRGEAVRVWVKIKSHSPFNLNPVLYTQRLFRAASTITTSSDGILIGALGAVGWCMVLLAIILQRAPFLWLAAVAAVACLREAAARVYLQRLLAPLDTTWSYGHELALDILYVALCALFIRSIARRDAAAIRGAMTYTAVVAGLLGCLLLAMFLPLHGALLTVPDAMRMYQVAAGILSACMLVSAIMQVRSARAAAPDPAARRMFSGATLLGLSALFIVADATLRTTGSLWSAPLMPVSFILESGSPLLALLALAGNLTVLTLMAARLRRGMRRARLPLPSRRGAVPAQAVAADNNEPAMATAASRQALILGYVGHDLRAPLAIISGYIRLMRQAAAPAQHAHLDVIERSVGHQFSLVEEILAYSKTELQPFTLNPEDVDLSALLEELAQFGVALCTHQQNSFRYLPAPTLPAMVSLDARRLRQAVLNLLTNAAKFTTNGKVRFEAQVLRSDRSEAELYLGIFNDGPHISLQEQDQIFLAFRQLHRREAGLGLGLFIVERIAQGMGGTVRVDSSPELGTRFSLTVPIRIIDPVAVATRPISRMPARGTDGPQLAAPPLAVRLALSRLARDGELTEIESWVSETRATYPQYANFYDEVAKCVDTFDMECLQRLALQGVI